MACSRRVGARARAQTPRSTAIVGKLILCDDLNSPGSPNPDASSDACGWARKLNSSWIVQAGLDRDAEDYMRHLETSDPPRLERSCQNARLLVDQRPHSEDP